MKTARIFCILFYVAAIIFFTLNFISKEQIFQILGMNSMVIASIILGAVSIIQVRRNRKG